MSGFGGSSSKKMKAEKHPMDGGADAAVALLESWDHAENLAHGVRPQDFHEDVVKINEEILFLQSRNEELEEKAKFLDQTIAHKTEVIESLQDVINANNNYIRTLEERVQTLEARK